MVVNSKPTTLVSTRKDNKGDLVSIYKIEKTLVYDKKKKLFNEITKSNCIKFHKKIEVCIYGLMPVFIGKLRKIKKNMHK